MRGITKQCSKKRMRIENFRERVDFQFFIEILDSREKIPGTHNYSDTSR